MKYRLRLLCIAMCVSTALMAESHRRAAIPNGKRAEREFGYPAVIGLKPYFEIKGGQKSGGGCTGSVFNHNCVLTAAHCLKQEEGGKLDQVRVFSGEQIERSGLPLPDAMGSSGGVRFHPKLDLAIFKLNRSFSKTFLRENLPEKFSAEVGSKADVVGYGMNKFGSLDTESETERVVYPKDAVWGKKLYGTTTIAKVKKDGEIVIEPGDPSQTSAASGDSGGPLITGYPKHSLVHAIAQGGIKRFNEQKKDFELTKRVGYTPLAQNLEWLEQQLTDLKCGDPSEPPPKTRVASNELGRTLRNQFPGPFPAMGPFQLESKLGKTKMDAFRVIARNIAHFQGEYNPTKDGAGRPRGDFNLSLSRTQDGQFFSVQWYATWPTASGQMRRTGFLFLPTREP